MHINKTHLHKIDRAAHTLRLIADTLVYNIKYNRVSHTVGLLRRLYKCVGQIQYETTDNGGFAVRLEKILLSAQIGPTEFQLFNDKVYINGTFKLEELRSAISASDLNATLLISQVEDNDDD